MTLEQQYNSTWMSTITSMIISKCLFLGGGIHFQISPVAVEKLCHSYLTERCVSTGEDYHHGDVIASVRHLQHLHLILRKVLVLELGLLEHHVDLAGATAADLEI